MKRARTRIITAAIAVAALALPLAACSADGGASDGQVEISFFHRWPNEPKKTYYDEIVKQFEQQNPGIKVNVERVLNDSYKDKVKVVAGSANAPDLMFSWSGTFTKELVEGGNVMDLGPWLKENSDFADSFHPSQLEPFNIDGAQYGLPVGMQSKVFFYNKDVFDDLGLDAPTNWAEFTSVLDSIKSKDMTPIEYGAQDQWTIAHWVGTLNQRTVNPDVFESDQDPSKGEFTDPGYVTALKRFQELSEYMNDDMAAINHEVARNSWVAGDAPIFYAQSAEVGYFGDAQFDYGTFNFPAVKGGEGDPKQLTGAPEGFVIAKNTKHPDETKRLLEFILSKENGVKYMEDTGELSPIKGAVDEADVPQIVKDMSDDIIDASQMTPWLDNAYDPQIVQVYLSETQLMLGGQQTPEGVMKKVQEAAERTRNAS
ncbi:extracellular solute-binding protein [Paramicrobacterium chengjingii]|uniref:extracellular solute-binding protein n=1 Tax=Paramicrobacterium chengjingii TaxID=2769067 RepID=UPI001421CDB5|nr:extracellular solute-binding protein [Microbacterium chengjingii]